MATNRYKKMWNSYETERMRMMSGENRKVTILEQFFSKIIAEKFDRTFLKDEEVFEKELRNLLAEMHKEGCFDSLNIAKPYSFVLTDDDRQSIVDLLIIDDDTIILSEDLLKGFDEEMDEFLKKLLEE